MGFVTADNHPQEELDAADAWLNSHPYDLPAIVGRRKGDPPHIMRKEIGPCLPPPPSFPCDPLHFVLCRELRIQADATPSSCGDRLVWVDRLQERPFRQRALRKNESTRSRTHDSESGDLLYITRGSRRGPKKRLPLRDDKSGLRIGPARTEAEARDFLRDLRSYRNLRPGIYVPGPRPQPLWQPMPTPGWWWEWRPWRQGESREDKEFVDWKWRGRDGAFIVTGSRLYSLRPPSDPLLQADAGIHRALRHIQCDGRATEVRYTRAAHVRYTRDTWGAGILLRMYYRQGGMHAQTRNSQRKHNSAEAQLAPWMTAVISRKDYDGDWPEKWYSTKRAQGWLLRRPRSHPPHYDLLRVEIAELEPLAYTDRGFAGEVSRLLLLGYSPEEVAERLQWQAHKIRSFKVDWAEWLQIPAAEVKTALRRTKKRKLAVKITIVPPANAEGRCATVEFGNEVE